MNEKFIIVGMTPEVLQKDEVSRITDMLSSGIVDYMHIRHPEAPRNVMEAIIEAVPGNLHNKLRIHSHFDLLEKYNLAGAHLSGLWPTCNVKDVRSLTKSCHKLLELWNVRPYDYVTLSPLYGDKSKPGNVGNFNRSALTLSIKNKNVVALGGVAPDKFAELRKVGFYGAGMLGYLWQEEYFRSLRQIKMYRHEGFYLQYITTSDTPEGVSREVRTAIEGGCRWVQIRMKEADDETIAKAVSLAAPICHAVDAILLINDRVDLAAKLEVDGVHIGRTDMPPKDARKMLGELKIIGCTANTLDDILDIDRYGVADYVCLGPMRHTATKKYQYPPIGYETLLNIFDRMHEYQIDIPVAVSGGITLDDVEPLKECGVAGIQVNSAIANAEDPVYATEEFVKKLRN